MSDESEVVRRFGRRSGTSGAAAVAIARPYEEREIVVAQGIEFHNQCSLTRSHFDIPDGITYRPNGRQANLDIVTAADGTATYVSDRQRVRFTVSVVNTKSAFKTALEKPGIHVVYQGHARYGRGPCFGDASKDTNPAPNTCTAPGDDWEKGSNSSEFGIFRMAYPYLAVPVSEVLSHGYKAPLVPVATQIDRTDCHPDLRRYHRSLRGFTFAELDPSGQIAGFCDLSIPTPAGAQFWGFDGRSHGTYARHVVLKANWTGSDSAPADLGAIDLRARVFCHFGCSTFKHNYRILRFHKNWSRTDTDRFAYWTTGAAYSDITRHWIYHLLTYRRRNAFESWRPSLRYAVSRTNRDLRALRQPRRHYRVI